MLVILCDLNPIDGRSPAEQERVLLDELGRYRPELLERPRLVVGSKADVARPDVEFDGLRIASVTRAGLDEFRGRLATLIEDAREAEGEAEPYVVFRPEEQGFSVVREGPKEWRVQGRPAERAVALADLTNPEAMAYIQQRLQRMGVEKALARAGATDGDVVRIGGHELVYEEPGVVAPIAVVKVGTSSIAQASGELDDDALTKLAGDLAPPRAAGTRSCS